MTYNPGQFTTIYPYVRQTPHYLILGGPADGNEAQCAAREWPDIRVIGLEPSLRARRWQRMNGWNDRNPLLPYALSNRNGLGIMAFPDRGLNDDIRCASMMPDRGGIRSVVATVTIDELDRAYGPFNRAILWLDIEGYELEALEGAESLFNKGGVDLVNLEILERRSEVTEKIKAFFDRHSFELVLRWNSESGPHHDRIYVPKHLK